MGHTETSPETITAIDLGPISLDAGRALLVALTAAFHFDGVFASGASFHHVALIKARLEDEIARVAS